MALIDFTLSNARRFYSSMGNPLGSKGLNEIAMGSLNPGGEEAEFTKILLSFSNDDSNHKENVT